MGLKRPFDDEFPEFSFKHSRQGDNGDRVSAFGERVASDDAPLKPNISGEFDAGFQKLQWCDVHVDETGSELSKSVDNEFETSAHFSWITSSSSEDDAGMDPTAYSSGSPDDFEFNFPRRASVSFEDIYSSHPPPCSPHSLRKQVPIGPDHQAIIPLCCGKISNDKSDQTKKYTPRVSSSSLESGRIVSDSYEERLMGTCIVPMPDFSSPAPTCDDVGVGRRDCDCLDMGSLRCVRQHIMEAREKQRDALGQEKFTSLGFYDMGEELARKWSEEDEQFFHEVVYSSPDKNFWKNLSSMFPSRTKGEIVSYYFNIFMLRRRAAQNRSKLLDIDSDDDEWHESIGSSYQVRVGEDEDFAGEFPIRDEQGHEFGSPEDGDDDEDDDDDDDDDDDGDDSGNDALGDGREDVTIDYMSEALDNNTFGSSIQHFDKSAGSYGDSFDVQDNSCLSFELQANAAESCAPVDCGLIANDDQCLPSKIDGSGDGLGLIYFMDPCDSKSWDVRYPTDPIKCADLLPTCNMIEEIFGQGTWDSKKMDGH